ncbi:MAG: hypothetical protein JJU05_00340 [Verrucomicrobia bacterium]|nr:hypothetical protein [Verrucomicrobiota bacterium]MCH8526275.1 hypothetical protein [Kiritimatiellia bacterium]
MKPFLHTRKYITLILFLTAAGCGQRAQRPNPENRRVICTACDTTPSIPPGYLATLSSDEMIRTAEGDLRLKCPACGGITATPLPQTPGEQLP